MNEDKITGCPHNKSHFIPGRTYIIWNADNNDVIKEITPQLDADIRCRLFTQHNPKFIINRHENLDVVWVSSEDSISSVPPIPEFIMRNIEVFTQRRNTKSIIIFDVFDYLATPGDESFRVAVTMLRRLTDRIAMTDNVLLVLLDTKLYTEIQRACIVRSGVEEFR